MLQLYSTQWRRQLDKLGGHIQYLCPAQLTSFEIDLISKEIKGTVSPPERCDFTSSQQYNNNVL